MAEDEEEYEEVGGGSRLLGFMFGNVDNSGDLDVDYLDEDAKEHLSALADKLGSSLTDMDLIKSSPATTDASEQDFDEKAEDAIDYEDIDEQYDGPEIQAATEEDHLLPRKEFFSSDAFLSSLNTKASIFDDEDYDEDEETGKESKIKGNIEVESISLAGQAHQVVGDLEVASANIISFDDDLPSGGSLEAEQVALELAVFQNRENIERLEITGVGDPSGHGLGFSYLRVTLKGPITSAVVKKKAAASKGGSTVTGTDANLRRLSMDAAREVLLKFNVPEEQIDKLTRWHRIALVRKLSSEQAASGVKVKAMTLSKFARGQRISFLQVQQQTREKCQEIWDRQVQSLSAANDDEKESDSEANSDLDSFAGDLENLLDAEEFEEEAGTGDTMVEKADVARGLKMRRCHSFSQTEEEIEDAKAEAAFILEGVDPHCRKGS